MTRKTTIATGLGAIVAIAGIAYGSRALGRPSATAVTVETVARRHLEALVSASGKIQAKRAVNISADTMGRVTTLAVQEGDRVKKGDFLMQIDPRNLRTAVTRNEASVQAAESQGAQYRVGIESARLAAKLAEDTLNRQEQLATRGLITQEALEKAQGDVKMRRSDLEAQEQQVRTQALRLAQERATLESSRFDLSKVRIEAPIDGIITRRNIEEGETVMVGTMNNAGTVLLELADMSVIEAEIEVDETDIPSVRLGQTAKVTIDALPGQTFDARVTEIGNSPIATTGQASVAATNFKVVLTIAGQIPAVRPGFTCTAEITTAVREGAVAVPIQATTVREVTVDASNRLVREPKSTGSRLGAVPVEAAGPTRGQVRKELEGVFVVRDNAAVFVPITTGVAGDKYFEVLTGVNEHDLVVTGPFSSVRELKDGAVVTVQAPGAAGKS